MKCEKPYIEWKLKKYFQSNGRSLYVYTLIGNDCVICIFIVVYTYTVAINDASPTSYTKYTETRQYDTIGLIYGPRLALTLELESFNCFAIYFSAYRSTRAPVKARGLVPRWIAFHQMWFSQTPNRESPIKPYRILF